MRDMLWRIRPLGAPDLRRIASKLAELGWQDRSRMANLIDLEGPRGHSLVMVPRTSRMQLRLHYLTPYEERVVEAELLHQLVCEVADSVG